MLLQLFYNHVLSKMSGYASMARGHLNWTQQNKKHSKTLQFLNIQTSGTWSSLSQHGRLEFRLWQTESGSRAAVGTSHSQPCEFGTSRRCATSFFTRSTRARTIPRLQGDDWQMVPRIYRIYNSNLLCATYHLQTEPWPKMWNAGHRPWQKLWTRWGFALTRLLDGTTQQDFGTFLASPKSGCASHPPAFRRLLRWRKVRGSAHQIVHTAFRRKI